MDIEEFLQTTQQRLLTGVVILKLSGIFKLQCDGLLARRVRLGG